MAERIAVKFGTTEEELRRLIVRVVQAKKWDASRVYYVMDIDACTVKDTAYAVSDKTSELPAHPNGASAVQKLTG